MIRWLARIHSYDYPIRNPASRTGLPLSLWASGPPHYCQTALLPDEPVLTSCCYQSHDAMRHAL